MKTSAIASISVATLLLIAACAREQSALSFPEGQAAAGKEAAREMQCFTCHEIAGSDFPAPHAQPPVNVRLGAEQASWSRDQLAGKILAPAHPLAGGRMGDYSEAMTVRQLIDIVAYLQSLAAQELGAR